VAILSKVGLEDVRAGWDDAGDDDPEARLLWATCGGVRVASVYVPNGRSLDDPHYTYKLGWLERLRTTLDAREDPAHHVAICGDFNIAPDDRDVYDAAAFEGSTHTSQAERDALARLEDWGLDDVFRRHYDAPGLFSWWDYRRGDFHQGRGMRIDLVLTSASLSPLARTVLIDRNARKGKSPSDHAPVIVDFDV
jgi:exodeoxyribonuclease-3